MIIEYKVIMKDIIKGEKKPSSVLDLCLWIWAVVSVLPPKLINLCPPLGPLLMVWNKFFEAQISAHLHTPWGMCPITSHSSLSPLPCSAPFLLCFSLLVLIPFGCVSCMGSQFLLQGPFCHASATVSPQHTWCYADLTPDGESRFAGVTAYTKYIPSRNLS